MSEDVVYEMYLIPLVLFCSVLTEQFNLSNETQLSVVPCANRV